MGRKRPQQKGTPFLLFYSYAREDWRLCQKLETHLSTLQRQDIIVGWHDRNIRAGSVRTDAIDKYLNAAHIILLLISPNFIASDYCYSVEMKRAIERHEQGNALVIPIILRHCEWRQTPFGHLQCLPEDGQPVTTWKNRDQAFQRVAQGIRQAVEALTPPSPEVPSQPPSVSKFPSRRMVLFLGIGSGGLVAVGGLGILLNQWGLHRTPQLTPRLTAFSPPKPSSRLYIYRRHTDVVEAVAWSPDGTRVASGSWDKTVQIWDACNGTLLDLYARHTDAVYAVAWSPDSTLVATGAFDATVQVWNASSGLPVIIYQKHTSRVYAVAWSPNGRYIASGGLEKPPMLPVVHLWNAATGQLLKICRGHTQRIRHIAWSPDSQHLASCSEDATVRVWKAVDGTLIDSTPVYTYSGHTDWVEGLAWEPNGKRLASCSKDTTVRVWDALTGTHTLLYQGHSQKVETVAWRPRSGDPCIASGAEDNTVQVWRVANGMLLQTFHTFKEKEVESVTWSPDGTRLAFGSADQTVQVWSLPEE